MDIVEIKARKVFAGPGNMAYLAEAVVENDDGETFYVTAQDYDGKEYTVADKSVYDFLASDIGEPVEEFLEEYRSFAKTKESAYAEVFAKLQKFTEMLG